MSSRNAVIIAAAAVLTSTVLIIPTSGVAAQNWTTVTHNRMPIIEGSGRIVRQDRPVGDFRRFESLGSEIVEVRFGPTRSLVIAADDNILPMITSEVRDGTLKIATRGSFRTRGPIRVWLTTPYLEEITTSGSGDVIVHDVNNSRLALTINGSSDMRVTGRTGQLDVNIHGSGSAELATLAATNVDASVFGSGDATVRATRDLQARVFGSGTVRYVGRPENVDQQRFGSGRVIAAN
ncbi:MAG TPA: head GIN domain-containing protein [Sphingomicrobium sp.]|nr:head GIN domain-containing protein [Sphingomicrobium sp.]